MKRTKIMLAVIVTAILSYLFIALVVDIFHPESYYREALRHPASAFFMIIFGWIPSVVVGFDIDEKY